MLSDITKPECKKKTFFDENFVGAPKSSRQPLHQQQAVNGPRQLSPATGAIAGVKEQEPEKSHHLSTGSANNGDDSFQKLYSKELDLDEDEVPLILHELNDSAIHFISKDQYDRALSLLQKAQTLLDRLMFQRNPSDRFLIQVTMHNMALCFQKMGALEECALCLDACLNQVSSPYVESIFKGDAPKKLKRLKYECKIHMQICALLSQLNRHQEALCHAKRSVQISQYMINDLMELCELYNTKITQAKKREQMAQEVIQKKSGQPLSQLFPEIKEKDPDTAKDLEQKLNKSDLIYFDEQVSMLERTAHKFNPIVQEVAKRMVKHKDVRKGQDKYQSNFIIEKSKQLRYLEKDKSQANAINMRVLLGYLNQSEWMYLLNIGNIMQITPLTIHDLHSTTSIEVELARDSIIEKISYLAVSYFCVSTELRFLVNLKDNPNVDPIQVRAESEFWHGKALEISCSFLPSESPLVSHIYSSYKKHHAPVNEIISEERVANNENLSLKIVRPLAGIDQNKHSPMIRSNNMMNIALSPLNLSPNNYIQNKVNNKKRVVEGPRIKSPQKVQNNKPKQEEKSFRQEPKRDLLFQDELEDDSFIFKDEAESNHDIEIEIKKADVSPNNLTVGEDPAIDTKKYQKKGDPLNSTTQFNFKNMMTCESKNRPPKSEPKTMKKVESQPIRHIEFHQIPDLGDISSILKSAINDSTHNEFQRSLDLAPNISMSKPLPESGKTSHKVSIPNNEQQDPIYQKNKNTNKYEKIEVKKYLKDASLDDGLMKSHSQHQQKQPPKIRPKTSENKDNRSLQVPKQQLQSQFMVLQSKMLNNSNQVDSMLTSSRQNESYTTTTQQQRSVNNSRPFTQENFYKKVNESTEIKKSRSKDQVIKNLQQQIQVSSGLLSQVQSQIASQRGAKNPQLQVSLRPQQPKEQQSRYKTNNNDPSVQKIDGMVLQALQRQSQTTMNSSRNQFIQHFNTQQEQRKSSEGRNKFESYQRSSGSRENRPLVNKNLEISTNKMKCARTNVQTPTGPRGQTPPNQSLHSSAAKKSQQALKHQQEFLQAMQRGSVQKTRNPNIKVAKTQTNPADDISQMRNIQMQIQQKLDQISKLKGKNTKSAGKIQSQNTTQQQNGTSSRPMATVRNHEKKINFMVDYQSVNTFNTNSLETTFDHRQNNLKMGTIPNTPNLQSARGSHQPLIGTTKKTTVNIKKKY